MIVDQVVNNVDVGLFHARMLTLLRSTFPQTSMDIILRQELTNGFQSVYFPPTANTLGVYYGGDNNRKIMYIDGVISNVQAGNLVAGYAPAFGLQVVTNMNRWIQDSKATYLGMMSGAHLQVPEYLDFVGYSAGGAVAECLAWELRRVGNTQKKKVFTYGAPRPGGPGIRDGLRTLPVIRYMTPADPIPLVPPRLQDAPAMVSILPITVSLSWSNMVHPDGGVVVDSAGDTGEAVLPPEASVDAIGSLASWFFSEEMDPTNQHAMPYYVTCLIAAAARATTPARKKLELGPIEEVAVERRREVNKERDRVAAQVAQAQREQNNQIVNQPAVVLFRPVRMGKIWAVVFGDKIVCQGVREDTCRHLCRAGNDFLRSLPKQGLVDPITLAEQMESFLAYATSNESDWIPKLRTNLQQ